MYKIQQFCTINPMNLLLIILSSVIFALIIGFISDYYKSKIIKTISIIISVLFVLSFYYFLSTHFFHPEIFKPTKNLVVYTPTGNYYNLVLNAFKKGNLHISDSVKYPALKEKNIYRNFPIYVKRDPNLLDLLDTSFYKNKIYFYFGITPILLFYAPFNLISGLFLTDKLIVFILSSLTFIISLLIVIKLINVQSNKTIPFYINILNIFLIGLCNYSLFLLVRACSYEVAIASAIFFLFLCLYFLLIYFYTNKNSYILIFSIAMLLVLSVGCRPHYALFIPLFIFTIIIIENIKKRQSLYKNIFVFLIPCVLYCSVLAVYNYLRFHSFFKFGITYQLNNFNFIDWHFQIQDFLIGIKYNLFKLPIITNKFPIFSLYSLGNEFVTGIIYIFPLSLFFSFLPYITHNLWKKNKEISIFLIILTCIIIINFSIANIAGFNQRYISEYISFIILICIIIFYYLYTNTTSIAIKYLMNIFFILIYIFSIYMNISLLFCNLNSIPYKEVSSGNYEKIVDFLS